jgi:hypothetical protein
VQEESDGVEALSQGLRGQLAGYSCDVVAPADAALLEYRVYARPAIAAVGALTPQTRANAVLVVDATQLDEILAARARQP